MFGLRKTFTSHHSIDAFMRHFLQLRNLGMIDPDQLTLNDGGFSRVYVNKSTGAMHLFRPSCLDSVQRQLYVTLDEFEAIQKMHSKISAQNQTPVEKGNPKNDKCGPCFGTGQVWALIGQMEQLMECTACKGEGDT